MKYRSVVRAVLAHPWAILPEKLDAICELLSLRSAGQKLTRSEVAARIGDGRRTAAEAPQTGVAVLGLMGVVAQRMDMMEQVSGGTSTEAFGKAFDAAVADKDIRAIVIQIESPGGSVFGVEELAAKIRAARGTKPIIAIADSYAASAAYWIGSAAEKFYVAPGGQVGSIGVINVHTDYSAAKKKIGIKETPITAGRYKAEGQFGPLTDEARAAMQKKVDSYYSAFVSAVALGRGVSAQQVMDKFGQGRLVIASEAVELGMVDGIATFGEVLKQLGVGNTVTASSASKPAFSLKGMNMNPKIFGALVRIGMCQIHATEAEAEKALAKFCAVRSIAADATEDVKLDALAKYVADMAVTPVTATAAPVATQVAATPVAPVADADATRHEDIMAAVKLAGLDNGLDVALGLINDKTLSVSAALKKIQTLASEQRQPVGATQIRVDGSARDRFSTEARDQILQRAFNGANPQQIYSAAEQTFVDWKSPKATNHNLASLNGLARECLAMSGVSQHQLSRLSPTDIARIVMGKDPREFGISASSDGPAYNLTGMFSNILYDAAHVMLRQSYKETNTTYQAWAKQGGSLTDFRAVHKAIAGELPDPKAIPEDGEFDETTFSDGKESYKLTVWGQIFSCSWQLIVNDNLGAFTEVPAKQGRAMRRKQNRLVYNVLKDNAAMADTGLLFNSTALTTAGGHNNLASGAGAPSVTTLNTLTTKMMEMTGLNTASSKTFLNLMPKYILCPPALRGTVLELLGSTSYAVANGNSGVKNIWENGLTPVFDAELGTSGGGLDTSWYLAADNRDVDTVEYAYLQGLETPAMDKEMAFSSLAIRFRIYQAFATKALDFRGLQKHVGA